MEAGLDEIVFALKEYWAVFLLHFAHRTVGEWLFFFMPFYVFGEFPMYVVPAIILGGMRLLGLDHEDQHRKRAFMATNPSVSVLLVGLNEEASIERAIDSLLELEYPGLEIVVVDDGSTDRTYELARPYADRGQIKLFKNTGASGRAGRPSVSNLALQMSSGSFIISVDADTSFDRDMLVHMIEPFHDPRVGAVAGNIKARNVDRSVLARLQTIEYFISIGIWKRFLNLFGANVQASGAFGAFRRGALEQVGGWSPELAEDADLSLKVRRSGWKVVFAPRAIAMTSVPESLKVLIKQRNRWDRGMLRTYYHKHGSLLNFLRYDPKIFAVVAADGFFTVVMSFVYVFWLLYMAFNFPVVLGWVLAITYGAYVLSTLVPMLVSLVFSERGAAEWRLLPTVLFFPLYKEIFRWVRLYALTLESFRANYEDSYLPASAWRNTPKW